MILLGMLLLVPLAAAGGPDPAFDRARLGMELAAWARARNDPEAMLVAARVMLEARTRSGTATDAGIVADSGASIAGAFADEAEAMRPQDGRIVDAARAIRDSVPRGFVGGPSGAGPVMLRRRLGPRSALSWSGKARAMESAIVSAVGDGDSDIDLEVTDAAGRAVCRDSAGDFHPVCRWNVKRAAAYRIRVINRGRVPSDVMVLSN
jgi:hypothetical protein